MSSNSQPSPQAAALAPEAREFRSSFMELIASMRFAIALLCMIAIASVIGTIVKQNDALNTYVDQFGPFWFEVFDKLSIFNVYSAWWFLVMMSFLVISTSLCITRNAPKMLKDARSWREKVQAASLRHFHHHHEWQSQLSTEKVKQTLGAALQRRSYGVKLVEKEQATLLCAKRGAANKWGYIFAHCAIVLILLGGLLDSDLSIRFQEWFGGKRAFSGSGLIAKIPAEHRLSVNNPSFRGNITIPEGAAGDTAVLARPEGALIQELPFVITLKRFHIEYYSTGMPKLFASDVIVRDKESGEVIEKTIKVNEPLIYKGIAMYQASTGDGGSKVKVKMSPMQGPSNESQLFEGEIGSGSTIKLASGETLQVEWSELRTINVENMARPEEVKSEGMNLEKHLGSAAKSDKDKTLKNVGPSFKFRIVDKAGQAREFDHYMQPILLDGNWVFLVGVRNAGEATYRYLRIPSDAKDSLDEWLRLRAALQNPEWRTQAANAYAKRALADQSAAMRPQLAQSSQKGLEIFAGANSGASVAGFAAVSQFLAQIPEADQERAAQVFLKILNGSLWDLWMVARQAEGLPELEANEANQRFLQLATTALSDANFYTAPVLLQLDGFSEVKASVLQLTRAPGKKLVYLGSLFLVIGIFVMFYVPDRRAWCWVTEHNGGSVILFALSTQRKTLDFEKEYENLKLELVQASGAQRET